MIEKNWDYIWIQRLKVSQQISNLKITKLLNSIFKKAYNKNSIVFLKEVLKVLKTLVYLKLEFH